MYRIGVVSLLRNTRYLSNINKKIYTPTHEWILKIDDNNKLGLSKYAVEQLDNIIYMEFNCEIGDKIQDGDEPAVVESVKAVGNINVPKGAEITDINHELLDNLDLLNDEPECDKNSWIFKYII